MMNDVKALSDAPPSAGLIEFVGAYHTSEDGQVWRAAETACGRGAQTATLMLPPAPSQFAPVHTGTVSRVHL